jgi:hypothetical protein
MLQPIRGLYAPRSSRTVPAGILANVHRCQAVPHIGTGLQESVFDCG